MQIKGIEHRSREEVEAILAAGGRFVFYEMCISLLVITLRRPSAVYLMASDELGLRKGLPYTLVSLLLGWWGIPWGIIYTPITLFTNLSGGRDVTPEARAWLADHSGEPGTLVPGGESNERKGYGSRGANVPGSPA
jgi:hypothetical protein